jgi:Holliday junction resolvasome RuvABC endonuclease subunit
MRIVGIDPSLARTGLCVLCDKQVVFHSIETLSSTYTFIRQTVVVEEVLARMEKGDIIIMEDFGVPVRFSSTSGKFIERVELCGMLKYVLGWQHRHCLLTAPPTMMKLFITGKGNADKRRVKHVISTVWSANPKNDDEADAFGYAALAKAYIEKSYWFDLAPLFDKFRRYGDNHRALVTAEMKGDL